MPNYPTFTGVAIDPRTEVQKAADFRTSEEFPLPASTTPEWIEKPRENWRRFPARNQAQSYSCMAHSGVKLLGLENVVETGDFVELSALPVYHKRLNFPTPGMWQHDLLQLLSKPTACLESSAPSMELTEEVMNKGVTMTPAMLEEAMFYRANGYDFMAPHDIDRMEEVIRQGKGVHLVLFFLDQEYWREVPEIKELSLTNDQNDARIRRHGVVAVDCILWEGEKALVIEDSAGIDGTIDKSCQRVLTESFLKARCYGAGKLMHRKNAPESVDKPSHFFSKRLRFGMRNDNDVAKLQQVLQYEGFLVTSIDGQALPLGNFLQMTAAALRKWQVKHGIMDFANEPDVRKIVFGPKSIGLANRLYN